MKDLNFFRFSGVVERFDRITTKTGMAMISFVVRCWKERVRVVAFRDLAEQTTLAAGDRVEIVGRVQGTEWQDKDGNRRSGWQVIASEIHIADDTLDQQHEQPRPPARQQEAHQGNLFNEPRQDTNARFQYQDGPF